MIYSAQPNIILQILPAAANPDLTSGSSMSNQKPFGKSGKGSGRIGAAAPPQSRLATVVC
jgi:hypothetical protein